MPVELGLTLVKSGCTATVPNLRLVFNIGKSTPVEFKPSRGILVWPSLRLLSQESSLFPVESNLPWQSQI